MRWFILIHFYNTILDIWYTVYCYLLMNAPDTQTTVSYVCCLHWFWLCCWAKTAVRSGVRVSTTQHRLTAVCMCCNRH